MLQRATAIMCVCAVLGALVGCGGDDGDDTPTRTEPGLSLVNKRQIAKLKAGSVERAFFDYWSSLQFQAWPQAAGYFSAGLRAAMGGEREIIPALRLQASYVRTAQPRLVSTTRSRGLVTVKYTITAVEGGRTPRSVTWRRGRDGWEIVYDAFMDNVLAAFAEARARGAADPGKKPSPRVQRAGERASDRQAAYLSRVFKQVERARNGRARAAERAGEQP